MSRGRTLGDRLFVRPGIRAHAMKYNCDAQARRRLRGVLQVLDDYSGSVALALAAGGATDALPLIRAAIVVLVYGERGEFR